MGSPYNHMKFRTMKSGTLRWTSSVKSASRTIDILEQIARRGPATAREIARATRIPESSLSYLLSTLVERDWLCSLGDRTYALGAASRASPPGPHRRPPSAGARS